MATVIERDVIERDVHHHHTDEDASAMGSVIVALLAIVLIVGLALYAFRFYPFAATPADDNTINVNVEGQLPNSTNP